MRKYAVFGGFLGSGKTTTMMALTKSYSARFGRAAMISNDLGEGVDLADDRLARLGGCSASQITDECICFCHDVLREKLEDWYAAGCELVVSDIPGFGVGALEHVYHGLEAECPEEYELAPFTVLTEPRNVSVLRTGGGDMAHILDAQLREADLIVLNKCDTLDDARAEEDRAFLAARYPEAEVIALSALTGEGIEKLCLALREGKASLRHPAIDYDDEDLQREMGSLSEYYLQYHAAVCCFDFDGNAYLSDIAEHVRGAFRARGFAIPHLKLLAWEPEGDYGKADLLGTERPLECAHRFARPCTELAVILNASAACPADALGEILDGAVEEVSALYQLERTVFRRDCFGMGE